MSFGLTLVHVLERAGRYFGDREIVSREPDASLSRTTFVAVCDRSERLAGALGIRPGDGVATLAWNHARHLEAYFGVPIAGSVPHTINPRLHIDGIAYVMRAAADRAVIVDEGLLSIVDRLPADARPGLVIVWRAGEAAPTRGRDRLRDADRLERRHRSGPGDRGGPGGVRVLHVRDDGQAEGCRLLPPGARAALDRPASRLGLIVGEDVTFAAGVPTVWARVLEAIERDPAAHDLSSLRAVLIGGSAATRTDMDASMTKETAFLGREALAVADRRPLLFVIASTATPVAGAAVRRDGAVVGRVTAGAWSPYLEHGVGYVRTTAPGPWVGAEVFLDGDEHPATLVELPFYDGGRRIPRGLAG